MEILKQAEKTYVLKEDVQLFYLTASVWDSFNLANVEVNYKCFYITIIKAFITILYTDE